MASARVNDHTVALSSLNHVIVYHRHSLLVTDTLFKDRLGLRLGLWQLANLSHVLFVTFDVKDGDS